MKAILLESFGKPELMKLGDWPTPIPTDDEILVKIHATAVNRADTLQRQGQYPPPPGESPILGLEMAGVIVQKGAKVDNWEIGDKVCGLLGGGAYATHAVIHKDLALPIPPGLSMSQAAAIPEVFLTAFQAIVWLAKLQKGESILIHAGASGVGTAGIQLAKKIGAQVIVTASATKHELCTQLGADHCIDYKSLSYADEINKITKQKGVDVIIDFVGGTYFNNNLKSLAIEGRMVMLAFLGGIYPEQANLGPILRKRLTIIGSTLRARTLSYKIALSEALQKYAWNDFSKGSLTPVIDTTFPLKDVAKAHQRMEANKNQGKIILTVID